MTLFEVEILPFIFKFIQIRFVNFIAPMGPEANPCAVLRCLRHQPVGRKYFVQVFRYDRRFINHLMVVDQYRNSALRMEAEEFSKKPLNPPRPRDNLIFFPLRLPNAHCKRAPSIRIEYDFGLRHFSSNSHWNVGFFSQIGEVRDEFFAAFVGEESNFNPHTAGRVFS